MEDGSNILGADAAIEANDSTKRASRFSGAKIAAAAAGSLRPVRTDTSEQTPLLSQPGSEYGSAADDDGGRSRAPEDVDEASPFAHLPWWQRPSIYWLLPPYLMIALAFGGSIVPKMNIILALFCKEYYATEAVGDTSHNPMAPMIPIVIGGDNLQCQENTAVQGRVALFTTFASVLPGLLSAIAAPMLGSYSDRHGRTRVIAFCSTGGIISDLATIVIARYPDRFSPWWLLPPYACEGLTGGFLVALALLYAYAADTSSAKRRDVIYGRVQGCLFTGIAFGPLIAAFIAKATGNLLIVIYILVCAHLFFCLFNLLVVPESLAPARQKVARAKALTERQEAAVAKAAAASAPTAAGRHRALRALHAAAAGPRSVLAPLRLFWPTVPGSSPALRRNLLLIAAMDACIFVVAMGLAPVLVLYTELRFGWATFENQLLSFLTNGVRVAMLLVGLPLLVWLRPARGPAAAAPRGVGTWELGVIRASVLLDLLGYVGVALAPTGGWLLAGAVLSSGGSLASPTLSAALTKHVPPERVGGLLGASALLHALGRVAGPLLFSAVYAASVATFPQAVFIVLCALFAAVAAMSWFIRPHGACSLHTTLTSYEKH